MTAANGTYDITARTWTHIKVLYILVILLSAVALALFIVCFMMVLEVQRGLNSEVKIRQDRENQFLKDVVAGVGKSSSQKAEILTSVDMNSEKLIIVDKDIRLSASTLTAFCVSIHSHCPLQGPSGAPGIPGESIRGTSGVRGYPGPQGVDGPRGPKGTIGAPGFGLMGFTGPPGDKGGKGIQGKLGVPGVKGQMGLPGLTGLKGASIKGEPGAEGEKGATGLPGHDGLNGLTGLKGEKGHQGEQGPQGLTGMKGEKGFLGGPGALGLKGEPGPLGIPGRTGARGWSGQPGWKGQKGERGMLKGEKGEPGAGSSGFGLKGEKGASGMPGLSGRSGLMGLRGSPGFTGPAGSPGKPGVAGEVGLPGKPGVAGQKGDQGSLGLPGQAGEPGKSGVVGPPGDTGRRGKRGHKGESGDVLQCECREGPSGEKGDPGVCNNFDSCKPTELQNDQPGPTPIHVLFQNSTIPEKKEDLTIKKIGKPVLYRNMGHEWGSWMVDSDPTPATKGKHYVTQHFTGRVVYEYNTTGILVSGNYSQVYNLQDQYYGTGGVIYRGAFYYHRGGFNMIARYELETRTITAQLPIEDSSYRGSESLFSTDYNYYDLAVDENGLWVVYAFNYWMSEQTFPNSLLVAKLESNHLDIEKTWNITVNRGEYANSLIAHGILYLLESSTAKDTRLSFVYDLYSHDHLPISIPFTNVFNKNRMLAYDYSNPANIMAWDNGRIVSYPVLLN